MTPRRLTLLGFVPMTVVLYLWVLVAPSIYGVSGWGGVGVLFFLGPVTVLFLLVVGVLVLAMRQRPRRFTWAQTFAAWLMWAALMTGGFVFEDAGDDTDTGPSVFTHLVGRTRATVQLGEGVLVLCAGIVMVSALALVVLLVWDLVAASRRSGRPVGG
ncbi:hypothetical protein ASE01_15245 [Nocardioides sp. Root190]|uniref:hypothetical protein n=1 Tax=Nocardioides sp. Root190 TaxID=1736488 RepID=UPI0006F8DB9A|nr:hypothetical protein [Nocardioides sp. Root190]KRB76348.1 hypothetical protein ASE01_15245 [Nocardioides sp. Root190]